MNKTCLNELHRAAGGRMVDFAGWEMPLLYAGIVDEHRHTRSVASAFDVSHMGRLEVRGGGAEALLQRACTRNVSKLAVGRCGYAHICNERGGILDDVIVARYPDGWLVVCNASNRDKIVAHLRSQIDGGGPSRTGGGGSSASRDVLLTDRTVETCMIAVQGPRAFDVLGPDLPVTLPADPKTIKRYGFVTGASFGVAFSLFRTGYTGEDGYEIVVPALAGPLVWKYLMESASRGGPDVRPAGLGARDTLRLEAAMPLYGHELHENIDPISAGCGWCVDLTKDFIGDEPMRRVSLDGPRRKLVGLNVEGRRIARQGAAVLAESGSPIGEVTSGTQSPTLDRVIAMAYVDAAHAAEGTRLAVDLGRDRAAATIVPLPFYKRSS